MIRPICSSFVAVIINTFGNIREETKHSAFAGKSWVCLRFTLLL